MSDKKSMAVGEDVDKLDFDNFKGIYFGDDNQKFIDPKTGAHFEYRDFCKRLCTLREKRAIIDKLLGIATESTSAMEESIRPESKIRKHPVIQPKTVKRRHLTEESEPDQG